MIDSWLDNVIQNKLMELSRADHHFIIRFSKVSFYSSSKSENEIGVIWRRTKIVGTQMM